MKNLKNLFVFFLICAFSVNVSAQPYWDYPVKPGMEEWAKFKSGREMVDACQIPEDILKTLSTNALALLCLNYPMYLEYMVVNDERRGISFMIDSFNGMDELSKRKDGTRELINIYRDYPVLLRTPLEASSENEHLIKLPFLEMLMADDRFISQLDDRMADELLQIVLAKYEGKLKNTNIYGMLNIRKTLLLGSVATVHIKKYEEPSKQLEVLKRYVENYRFADKELINEVLMIIF